MWAKLARLPPYCSVCDVTYRAEADEPADPDAERDRDRPIKKLAQGTRFRAWSGQYDAVPEADGMVGEVVEYERNRRIATRLDPHQESAYLRIELSSVGTGSTDIEITVALVPRSRSRFLRRATRNSYERLAASTVAQELERLPAHLELEA